MAAEPPPETDLLKDKVYPTEQDGYTVLAEIGTGAFATVYKAKVTGTNEDVAIKVLELEKFNTQWEEIRKEIAVMSSLHHANIVKILVSFVVDADLWIVMPLLSGGSCASIMKKISATGFKDEALIATILRETLKGLEYLHKGSQLHRDVKAGNILVSQQGDIQLGDFGVAGTLMENGDRKQKRSTFTGTPCWMAPEVMEQSSGYDEKADIWSFGITAMELGFGHAPYAKHLPMKVLLMTLQEDPPTFAVYNDESFKFSKEFQKMVAKCLQKDPKERPSASKLLKNSFFKKARDPAYIVEKLVKPMPATEHKAVDNSKFRRGSKKGEAKSDKEKPLSVGPWSFGKEDLKAAGVGRSSTTGPASLSTSSSPSATTGRSTLPTIVSPASSEPSSLQAASPMFASSAPSSINTALSGASPSSSPPASTPSASRSIHHPAVVAASASAQQLGAGSLSRQTSNASAQPGAAPPAVSAAPAAGEKQPARTESSLDITV